MSTRSQLERTRVAAVSVGAIAVSYAVLSFYYFYEDFFKHVRDHAPATVDRAGIAVPVEGVPNMLTILSPWRMVLAVLAVGLLAVCAVSLWRNRPRAKVASLVALWGVLLPQVLWYTEFLVDWNAGVGVTTAVIGAIGLVALPTALLFDGSSTLTGWPLATGRIRILITAIAVGWLGLLATNMIDHSYQLDSWFAYTSALAAIPLAALSIYGLIRLRTWALWTSIGTALAVGMVAFAFTWTSYTLSGGYFGAPGYIDSFVHSTTSCSLRVVSAALLPALAIAALTAPFLHACFKRNTLVAHNE